MKKKIVIAGYYGFNNVGDEAVLWSIINDIKTLNPEVDFCVLSENPPYTKETYKVNSVSWRELDEVINTIEDCNLLIVGGGGLFNSYLDYDNRMMFSSENALFAVYVFGLPLLAYLMNKPCMIYAVGASNFNCEKAKKDACNAIKYADICTVRDPFSVDILKSFGCDVGNIRVTADPAFRLKNANYERQKNILSVEGLNQMKHPVVGVVLRNWSFYGDPIKTENEVAGALNRFIDVYGGSIIFLPFDINTSLGELGNDNSIISRVRSRIKSKTYVLKEEYSPSDVSSIITCCDIVLGMRLHSCIFSIKNCVPVIGLVYDQKVKNIMTMAEAGDFIIDINSIDEGRLLQLMQFVYENRKDITARFSYIVKEFKDKAFENAKIALELIDEKKLTNETEEIIKRLFIKKIKQFLVYEKELLVHKRITLIFCREIRTLINEGKFEESCVLLEELLRIKPNDPEWNYLLAFCLHGTKNYGKAEGLYSLALELGFDEFWVRYNRGALYFELGKTEMARIDFLKAKELNQTHLGLLEYIKKVEETVACINDK